MEATYDQLLGKWSDRSDSLHLDSWMEIVAADSYRVGIGGAPLLGKRLWYVNLGTYANDQFAELYANGLFVAGSADQAKARAKAELLKGWRGEIHSVTLGLEADPAAPPPVFLPQRLPPGAEGCDRGVQGQGVNPPHEVPPSSTPIRIRSSRASTS